MDGWIPNARHAAGCRKHPSNQQIRSNLAREMQRHEEACGYEWRRDWRCKWIDPCALYMMMVEERGPIESLANTMESEERGMN